MNDPEEPRHEQPPTLDDDDNAALDAAWDDVGAELVAKMAERRRDRLAREAVARLAGVDPQHLHPEAPE